MFSRKVQTEKENLLPNSWSGPIVETLEKLYERQCKENKKRFSVYGFTYPDEIVLNVSLLDAESEYTLPITYSVSADLTKKDNLTVLVDKLIDSVGVFFDSYWANTEGIQYSTAWGEIESKGTTLFYKVTRENIEYSMKANELLES
jgi:hypothetical protein